MENKLTYILIIWCLSALCENSYAQLSFRIDSVRLHSISDFQLEELTDEVIDEDVACILAYGPHIILYGSLANDSQKAIVYKMSLKDSSITLPIITTSFRYRGRVYKTDLCSAYIGDTTPLIKGNKSSYVSVGGEVVDLCYIPQNTSVNVVLGTAFLCYSKWCDLKMPEYSSMNKRHNIRNNKKLEKIAKEVLPTIQATIEIKTDWDAWSRLLIEGSTPDK